MIQIAAGLGVLVFMLVLEKSGAIHAANGAMQTTRRSLAILRNPQLDDGDKERALQSASLELGRRFVSIALRTLIALGAFSLSLVLAEWTGWVEMRDVLGWLAGWTGVLTATVLVIGWYALRRRS